MEQSLYNGALSGLSRDGTHYFYQNPLESDGSHQRWTWHPCPCCTMNVSRLVASVGGYFYSTAAGTVAVHLYGGSTARLDLDGTPLRLAQQTDNPWSGKVRIAIDPDAPARFVLKLRIPGWARSHAVALNGAPLAARPVTRGYIEIDRTWTAGDHIELDLPMPVERIYADPRVRADVGRVALKRGPIVYCAEQIDNPDAPVDLVRLPRAAAVDAIERTDLLGGVVTLAADGVVAKVDGDASALYRAEPPSSAAARITAVPYYAWANRGANRMQVWLAEG
jgi:DUF1680 family protein